jgi:protein-S-isoprenylcysteine O-methyltransferase Ste14
MANESAKKIVKKNALILRNAFISAAVAFVLHLLGLWFFESSSGGWYSILVYLAINGACLGFFKVSSNPTFDSDGSLQNPGQDLSQKGIMDFVWDFLYVTWLCQVVTLYSPWLWLLMLVIPIYGGFKLFGLAKSMGGLGQPAAAEPDAPTKRSRSATPQKVKHVRG